MFKALFVTFFSLIVSMFLAVNLASASPAIRFQDVTELFPKSQYNDLRKIQMERLRCSDRFNCEKNLSEITGIILPGSPMPKLRI